MINRCPSCRLNKIPTTPFYRVRLDVSTSVDPKSPEFIKALHSRIQSGIYVFVDVKANR